MSRSIVIAAVALLALGGCTLQPEVPLEAPVDELTCECTRLQAWLDLQRKVSAMSVEKVNNRLTRLGEPETPRQLFYFGLLQQQLDSFNAWTEARDTFSQLVQDESLPRQNRDLVAILQRYNQTRINWYLQHRQLLEEQETLKAQMRVSREENELLEQRIQALTEVETSISTRKEQ